MSRERAHELLDMARRGSDVPAGLLTLALIATGDIVRSLT